MSLQLSLPTPHLSAPCATRQPLRAAAAPLCKPFVSSASSSARPDKSYRRALYLPETSGKPRLVWIEFGDDGRPLDIAKCFPRADSAQVKTVAFHSRFLPYWVQISYDCNAGGRELTPNECVKQLLANSSVATGSATTDPVQATETSEGTVWRGPLVVLAYSAEDGLSKPPLDIDPSVLRPVVEYLRLREEYKEPIFVEQPQLRGSQADWKAVLGLRK